MKKKKGILYIVTTIFFLVMIISSLNNYKTVGLIEGSSEIIGPFSAGEEIVQQFVSKSENLDVLKIIVGTYQNNISGNINFELYDENNNQLKKKSYKLDTVEDNSSVVFKTDIKNTLNKKYILKITFSKFSKNEKIALVGTPVLEDGFNLKINNEEKDKNLLIYQGSSSKGFSIICLWYVILYLVIMFMFVSKEVEKDEKK